MWAVHSVSCSDRASIHTLVKKIGDIQELIKAVIAQAKGAKVNLECYNDC